MPKKFKFKKVHRHDLPIGHAPLCRKCRRYYLSAYCRCWPTPREWGVGWHWTEKRDWPDTPFPQEVGTRPNMTWATAQKFATREQAQAWIRKNYTKKEK